VLADEAEKSKTVETESIEEALLEEFQISTDKV
jgi:hypothetical protein